MRPRQHRTDKVLFVDVELTAWRGAPPPGQTPEIVEIGVAEVDNRALEIRRADAFLVRPARSSLSGFFTELTGITPDMVRAEGRPLEEVSRRVRKLYGTTHKTWFAWGDDQSLIREACRSAGAPEPFSPSFVDFAHLHGLLLGSSRRMALADALRGAGVEPVGRRHRAKDDAVDAARLWVEMLRRGRADLFGGPQGAPAV